MNRLEDLWNSRVSELETEYGDLNNGVRRGLGGYASECKSHQDKGDFGKIRGTDADAEKFVDDMLKGINPELKGRYLEYYQKKKNELGVRSGRKSKHDTTVFLTPVN